MTMTIDMDQYVANLSLIATGAGLIGFVLGVWLGNRTGQSAGAIVERQTIKWHHMEVMLEQVKIDGGWTKESRYWYRRLVKPLRSGLHAGQVMNHSQAVEAEWRRKEDAAS